MVSIAILCPLLYHAQALPGEQSERSPSTDTHSSTRNHRAWSLTTSPCWQRGLWQSSQGGGTAGLWGSQTPPTSRLPCFSGATTTEHGELAGCRTATWEGISVLSLALPALPYYKHPSAFQLLASSQNQRATRCKECLPKDFSTVLEMQG